MFRLLLLPHCHPPSPWQPYRKQLCVVCVQWPLQDSGYPSQSQAKPYDFSHCSTACCYNLWHQDWLFTGSLPLRVRTPQLWGSLQLGQHCLLHLHWSSHTHPNPSCLPGQACLGLSLISHSSVFKSSFYCVAKVVNPLELPSSLCFSSHSQCVCSGGFHSCTVLPALHLPSVTLPPLEIIWPSHLPTQLLLISPIDVDCLSLYVSCHSFSSIATTCLFAQCVSFSVCTEAQLCPATRIVTWLHSKDFSVCFTIKYMCFILASISKQDSSSKNKSCIVARLSRAVGLDVTVIFFCYDRLSAFAGKDCSMSQIIEYFSPSRTNLTRVPAFTGCYTNILYTYLARS